MTGPDRTGAIEARFRRGDYTGARADAEAALRGDPDDPGLLHLLGAVCCQSGDLGAGAQYLRRVVRLRPENLRARMDLAFALSSLGEHDEALAFCSAVAGDGQPPAEVLRLTGYILQSKEDFQGAVRCYERIVAGDPQDWEIWNNLGNARRAAGDLEGGIEALARARDLRPDLAPIHRNLAALLAEARRFDESLSACREACRIDPTDPAALLELGKMLRHLGRNAEALAPLREAVRLAPATADAQIELGRALAGARRLDEAEEAYRRASSLEPKLAAPYLELGIVFERANRLEGLEGLLREAERAGAPMTELAYLEALALRRDGRPAEALERLRKASTDAEPVRRWQLIGKLADGLGDSATAFAAFGEMNRFAAEDPAAAGVDAARFRRHVESLTDLVSEDWYRRWSPAEAAQDRPSPVFLIGFPRSGTTLLDTFLMGHEDVAVLEEEPILPRVGDALGDFARLAELDAEAVGRLRALYFDMLDRLEPSADGKLVVDKLPLNILSVPLIHRLFPDARLIFAQRHPCDVVLSCFMQNFELTDAMANFLDLADAAALYDLVLAFWDKCRGALPLDVHNLRYEDLVADPEAAVRPLTEFLGLRWDPRLLDHRQTAAERGTISTPSYSQVTEPIYRDAVGRWQRYRPQMSAVLPVLAPWVERLGYPGVDESG